MADVNESSIQSAVFQVELGRGKRVVQWILVVLVAIVLGVIYTAKEFRGLEKAEAMDMAQLARNISRGDGFTTYVIRPLSLWHLKEYGPNHDQKFDKHPDLYNPPLYPVVLAGLFKLLPEKVFEFGRNEMVYAPERWVILPFNQVCLLLCLFLAYIWAKELFDRRVAITVGLLLLFSNTLWSYGISGLPTTFLMLLVLASLYCLFKADRRLNPVEEEKGDSQVGTAEVDGLSIGLILASAVLLGLCFLTRYTTGFFVLPMAIYVGRILRGRRAAFWTLIFVGIFIAVITPWLVRNYQISQSLVGIAKYQLYGDESLQRAYKIDPKDLFLVRAVLSRVLTSSRHQLFDAFKTMGEDFFMLFFLVGVMYGFRRRDAIRLRGVILGCLFCAILSAAWIVIPAERVSPSVFGGNLFVLLLPLVAIYGVAFFYLLLDRIAFSVPLTRALAIGFFALVNVAAIVFALLPPFRSSYPYPPYIAPITRLVTQWFNADEAGTSDQPWSVAWYGDRRAVWMPNSVSEFVEIHDYVARAPHDVQFLFITPYTLDRPFQSELGRGNNKEWMTLSRGQLPQDFPLKAGTLLPPETDQILLADKVRWATKEIAEPSTDKSASKTNAPTAGK